ncbi:invasin domain 3-containing protein [Serratia microhaemolytica]|uniref:invasin domain 3-containing protein n=1 Tax=Serratia microhaemolytica TaxID=2675110 RepID=UPI000FDE8347|nr:invasin domain 3-containing protein [Serratia microhaemolytica]
MFEHFGKKSATPALAKRELVATQQRGVKTVAWAVIATQALFPLSLSFTPAIAGGFLHSAPNTATHNTATIPYVLGPGENVKTVAKRYDISVDELKKLNIYRSFAKPFMKLSQGDELDVPAKRSPFSADNVTKATLENQLAGYLVGGATLLSSDNKAKSAEQMARASASNAFNQSAQDWLGRFGTARIQLNLNEDYRLDGSEADLLLPLLDRENNLLFTQIGVRNKDSRTTVNIGAGWRHFQPQWMYGLNSFIDSDLTGHNHRLGIGAEIAGDYFKLSANGYVGLTDWHQSRDFADYNERPANGYDIRAEGYWPSYPQLGGKLMFEHYFGHEVALFGKDNRQKNPYALTAGLSYTPVPLLSFAAEHRIGKGGESDSLLSMQLNYRFGDSWQSHLDPAAVAASRTLTGSRYALVERNNSIVLDYQKQQLIRLTLPQQLSAEASSTVTVNTAVTAKYRLDRIEWDAASLIAAGGSIVQTSPQIATLKLPPYKPQNGNNSYTLSAVAYDNQGNASPRAIMQIEVLPSKATILDNNLNIVANSAVSNGIDANLVTVKVTDMDGNPVPEQSVTFSVNNNAKVSTPDALAAPTKAKAAVVAQVASASATTLTDSEGIAIASITNTTSGTTQVTVTVNQTSRQIGIEFIPDSTNLNQAQSLLTSLPDSIVADGRDTSTLTFTLVDAHNNRVYGQNVTFSSSLPTVTISQVTDNGDGTYSATLSSTSTGHTDIGVNVNGSDFAEPKSSVTLLADSNNLSAAKSTLASDVATLVANGTSKATLTFTLKDANDNPVSDQEIAFISSLANVTFGNVTDNQDGTYSVTLSGTQAGDAVITVNVNGKAFAQPQVSIPLTADSSNLSINSSALTTDTPTLIANGTSKATLTFTLKDANNNPVTGQTVLFNSTLANSTLSAVTDNLDGTYSATLSGTQAGNTRISVKVNNADFGNTTLNVDLELLADSANLSTTESTLTADATTLVANVNSKATLTFTLKDGNGNPVNGQTITFNSSLANGSFGTVTDNQDGSYTTTFSGTKAGDSVITASVNGTEFVNPQLTITLTADADNLSSTQSTLASNATTLVADGSSKVTLTFTLKDSNDNPVSGETVTFNSSLANTTFSTTTDNLDGTYTVTLSGTKAGEAIVTANVNGSAFSDPQVSIQLTADLSKLSTTQSTLSSDLATLVANGNSKATVTFTLMDANSNPVADQTVTFSSSLANTTFGTVSDNKDGTYTATFSGTKAGDAIITANVNSTAFTTPQVSVKLIADSSTISAAKATLTSDIGTLVANGNSKATLTFTLKDANDNPVSGQTVTFTSSLANSSFTSVTDNQDGSYTVALTGTQAGDAVITAKVNGNAFTTPQVSVTLIGDSSTLSTTKSTLQSSVTSLIANGTSKATLTFTLKDANDNPVIGQTVLFNSSLADSVFSAVTDNQDGTYTATLSGTRAGIADITAKVNNSNFAEPKLSITLQGDSSALSTTLSTLSADSSSIVADGKRKATLTFTLRDINSNPVAGQTITFNSSLANGSFGTVTDNQDGSYTTTFSGSKAGDSVITASVNGTEFVNPQLTITLTADTDNLSSTQSTLVADTSTLVATGSQYSTLTFTLKDANDNPVKGQTVTFSSSLTNSSFSATTDNLDGTYTVKFSGTKAGDAIITANVNGSAFSDPQVSVKLIADSSKLSTTNSTLSSDLATLVANGNSKATVTFTLMDANSNPVAGQTVTFSSSLANTTFGTVSDNKDGTYTATFSGTKAGDAIITANVNSTAFTTPQVSVKLIADSSTISAAKATLTSDIGTLVANGSSKATLTFTLKDANDNPVSGQTVTFTSSLANSSFASVTDNQDGSYTVAFTGTKAGDAVITAKVNGNAFTTPQVSVKLIGDSSTLSTTKSTLQSSVTSLIANGTNKATLTFTLKDANDNPVIGQTVLFNSSLTNSVFSTVTDNQDGTYTATLSGTKIGDALITVKVNGNDLANQQVSVKLIADSSNLSSTKSALTSDITTLVADGSSKATLTFTLKDANDNPVSGQTVTFTSSLANSSFASVTDNQNGTYTVTFTGTKAGDAVITANVNGNAFATPQVSVKLIADSSNLLISNSTLTSDVTTIVADGSSKATLTFRLGDKYNNPVSGQTVSFISSLTNTKISAVTDNQDGTYTATLTGTTAGNTNIDVKVNNSNFAAGIIRVSVQLTADSNNLSTTQSTLQSDKSTVIVDGSSKATLTFTLKDANGNLVNDQSVILISSLASSTVSAVTNNNDGTYTATLTSTQLGNADITVKVNNNSFAVTKVTVTFTADLSSATLTSDSLTVTQNNAIADNLTQNSVRANVTDKYGNPVAGATVTFSVTSGATLTAVNGGITDASGNATATLTSAIYGSYTVTATVNGTSRTALLTFADAWVAMWMVLSKQNDAFSVYSRYPSIGYPSASFTLTAAMDKANSDYNWSSSQSWATVTPTGVVTLVSKPTSSNNSVIIKATPKAGGKQARYEFTVKKWFNTPGTSQTNMTQAIASSQCVSPARVPSIEELTNAGSSGNGSKAVMGTLFGEWQKPSSWHHNIWSTTNIYTYLTTGQRANYTTAVDIAVSCVTDI